MTYKFRLEGVICCDECNDIIYNQFDCPICGEEDVYSDLYNDANIEMNSTGELEIVCEECKAIFIHKNGNPYDIAIWEVIE